MKRLDLGLTEALQLTLESIEPLAAETVNLIDCGDRVAASDIRALVDSPSMDTSRKDGYAASYQEIAGASAERPARLRVIGSMAAGGVGDIQLEPGSAVRVLTGARLPRGADVVVAEEDTSPDGDYVIIHDLAESSKNILRRGSDVALHERLIQAGHRISPIMTGLLAAAGHSEVPVFRNPLAGIIGTGDEIVEPGKPLSEGKLYASNIVSLAGLCKRYKMTTRLAIVKDDPEAMFRAMQKMAAETDALITSGGAWRGDRDLVAEVLERLGWKKIFHQIRIGPGKAVGFGLLEAKPVFILPGGPPSNLMGFLQIALPGLLALGGQVNPGLPRINALLAADIEDGKASWTDFFYGTLDYGEGLPVFHPMAKRCRLNAIAQAKAVAMIPEGQDRLSAGAMISVQLLG
ncbi:molybdopterin biosynthesis protein MoeA [Desulfocarbo indianensis]|nr:molybdopterin biosynthesis protein MoeA [Desulfocarbo indianensis]